MQNLGDYYRKLLAWEGLDHRTLVDQWPEELRSAVESAFVTAASAAGLHGSICPHDPGATNQSIGNWIAKFTAEKLAPHLPDFRLEACAGSGYPDKLLTHVESGLRIPVELKATSTWCDKNSQRRVLTSSSRKLRNVFPGPIHHLLVTVVYSVPNTQNPEALIGNLRLDFLEPFTEVSVRLEAAVTHKSLNGGSHHSRDLSESPKQPIGAVDSERLRAG